MNEKIKEQLLSKIKIDDNGCWIFQESKLEGYGEFRRVINGIRFHTAHRVSYYLFKGNIPEGMMILHKCSNDHKKDNPKCVNPDHLYCGTHINNMKDMSISGVNSGKNNPMYGKPGTRLGVKVSEETKRKLSERQLGEKNHMFGKRGKNNPNFGKTRSYKPRQKMKGKLSGCNNPSSKSWEISDINKNIFTTNDMVSFCNNNKINYYSFVTNKSWKGWKCKILKKGDII